MVPRSPILRSVALLAAGAALLPGCSRSGGGTTPAPIQGRAYSTLMPMHPGDRYECAGLVLRIEPATETNLGTSDAMRIVFEYGGNEFGLYWSEPAGGATLHHGAFDTATNKQVVLPTPEAAFPGFPNSMTSTNVLLEYDAIGATSPARQGSLVTTVTDPLSGPRVIRPQWYSRGSLYGTVYWHQMEFTVWQFAYADVAGSYVREVSLWSNPGYGPLTITVDGTSHEVVRAVIDGVRYE